jgi:lipoate-protein ligase B
MSVGDMGSGISGPASEAEDQILVVRRLGRVEYEPTWRAMQAFTAARTVDTPDEFWLLEHPPVYTQGQAGKPEHLLRVTDIPVIRIDRGGQITYHGPGQLVIYTLVDLRRRGYGIRDLVQRMEQAVIDMLATLGVVGERISGAPGVYVGGANRRAGAACQTRLHLSRSCAECGYGPGAVFGNQSVRLAGSGGDPMP